MIVGLYFNLEPMTVNPHYPAHNISKIILKTQPPKTMTIKGMTWKAVMKKQKMMKKRSQ